MTNRLAPYLVHCEKFAEIIKMDLKPLDIRFSQDSIGSTFGHYTCHPFRPIGNTLDDILSGRCNINSIPSISVIKRNGLWFTADNRRLWVFQEAEKRGKCSEINVRETSYINENKFTTINNGVSIYVRGDPGGFLWRRMREVSRDMTEPIPEVSTMYSDSFINTSTDSIVTEISTRKIDNDVSIPSASFGQRSLSSEDDLSENSPDNEESYSNNVRGTNRAFPKPAEEVPSEKLSECEQNYSVNIRERKVEEMEVDSDKQSESLPDITDVSGNNHDEKASAGFSLYKHCDRFSNQQSSELSINSYGHYGVLLAEDEVNISADEIVAPTEQARENKAFVGDEFVMEDRKSGDAMEKEEAVEKNKVSRKEIRKNSYQKLFNHTREHFVLNMEKVSRKPQNKCKSTRKIICVSSVAIVLLLVVFFLLHLLYFSIRNMLSK